ncbi:MAG TPA: hypothetical protein DDZ83_09240 [Nitrospinae bacterium]|nr:hypothetical protein [Nitrospinota bacterium]
MIFGAAKDMLCGGSRCSRPSSGAGSETGGMPLIADAAMRGAEDDRVMKGFHHLDSGDCKSAKAQFDEALTNNFSNIGVRLGLCQALVGLDEVKEAEKTFEAACSLEPGPGYVKSFNRLGIGLWRIESYDLALRAFTRASDINSNDPILYYNMSLVHIVQLQLDEAEILFEKALKLKPDFVEAKQVLEKVSGWKENLADKDK